MGQKQLKSLKFEVDGSSDLPLWVQLRNRLVYLIDTGYFKPGEQLPTVRALASDISINYNTVNKAYLGLKSDGYIESTRGRGAFVRDLRVDIDEERSRQVDAIVGDCISACRELGLSLDEVQKCVEGTIKGMKRDEGVAEDGGRLAGQIVTVDIGHGKRRENAGA